jgi:hypothetical protein
MSATNAKTFTATWLRDSNYKGGMSSNLADYLRILKETKSVEK